jgi:hypothetical protein
MYLEVSMTSSPLSPTVANIFWFNQALLPACPGPLVHSEKGLFGLKVVKNFRHFYFGIYLLMWIISGVRTHRSCCGNDTTSWKSSYHFMFILNQFDRKIILGSFVKIHSYQWLKHTKASIDYYTSKLCLFKRNLR